MLKSLSYQSKHITYRDIGQGKPVFLVHGFGEDGEVWKNQVQFFRNKFRLIIPDLPGSGQSEIIDDMSMEGMARVLYMIMKQEQIDQCPVIGHSMGGYITLAFAEAYPDMLSGFGLFHSSAYADTEEKKATRRKGIGFIKEHGAFQFLETAIPNLFSPVSKEKISPSIDQFIKQQHNFSVEALVRYYEAMMQRPDRTTVLKEARVPVLFIMGKYDNALPFNDSLEQSHLPENSYIHVLRESVHMGMMEEPDKSNKALDEFLLHLSNQ